MGNETHREESIAGASDINETSPELSQRFVLAPGAAGGEGTGRECPAGGFSGETVSPVPLPWW